MRTEGEKKGRKQRGGLGRTEQSLIFGVVVGRPFNWVWHILGGEQARKLFAGRREEGREATRRYTEVACIHLKHKKPTSKKKRRVI